LFPKITIKIYGLASKRMFNNINSIWVNHQCSALSNQ
jgi:hypothetical protein